MLMAETPWSYPVTCNSAGINMPPGSQDGAKCGHSARASTVRFLEAQQNHPVNGESHSSLANTFLPI